MIDDTAHPQAGMTNDETQADGRSETPEADEQDATQVLDDLEQLRTKAEERDKFLQMLQRTRADFENYQKRVHRDMEQERRYALKPLAAELLPALDNLERALDAATEDSPLRQGVAMVKGQILAVLERHGITRVEGVSQPFDPHRHEAVMQQPAPGKPANTVLQVLEPGYMYHDRVLRPSKVIVSSGQ